MDGEKDDVEHGDPKERMKDGIVLFLGVPSQQLFHEHRSFERGGGFEHDADLLSVGIEGRDMVVERLPLSPVSLVLVAVAGQITMQLEEDTFRDAKVAPSRLDRIHDISVTSNLLFIA